MIRGMVVTKRAEVGEGLRNVLRLAGGIEVTGITTSLDSAVEGAGCACPDFVMVDLDMPDGEGYETIRTLKRLHPQLKLVALTAHDYPAARESALRVGADIVMVKGVTVTEMISVLRRLSAGIDDDFVYDIGNSPKSPS